MTSLNACRFPGKEKRNEITMRRDGIAKHERESMWGEVDTNKKSIPQAFSSFIESRDIRPGAYIIPSSTKLISRPASEMIAPVHSLQTLGLVMSRFDNFIPVAAFGELGHYKRLYNHLDVILITAFTVRATDIIPQLIPPCFFNPPCTNSISGSPQILTTLSFSVPDPLPWCHFHFPGSWVIPTSRAGLIHR